MQKEIRVVEKKLPTTSSCWIFFSSSFCIAPLSCLPVTLSLISFDTSAKLCAVRKVILEFLNCADIYWTLSPSLSLHSPSSFSLPSPLHRLFFARFLSASCQHWQSATQALAARLVTDAAAVGQTGEREQELKRGELEIKRAMQRAMQRMSKRHIKGKNEKKKDGRDTRGLALHIVSKGTQCWIRPRPIITARWAVEGCGQRGRLKNKIDWEIFRVRLQNNFIVVIFPLTVYSQYTKSKYITATTIHFPARLHHW